MRPGRAVASFDSTTGLLRGLSNYLAGRDAPLLDQLPAALEPAMNGLMAGVNRLH
ncbi:hypothetical protein [Saccharopolyspora phatthalungensis]|uniref:Uncharacterized protein n=1 Tax=Saccharopolyspora phatthalungensis TaxID=664693 RepID=A0A840Q852_9PSEU|nr:hypothetical protein [Saccharopolyspora phatthalungensis]MBB5156904.1 hypothetical protein [Saccharopolyspora phatthalungensis]